MSKGLPTSDWMLREFTHERMVRWMDGANPGQQWGHRSFIQVLTSEWVWNKKRRRSTPVEQPNLWSVVMCSVGRFHAQYYLKVRFHPLTGGSGYKAELTMWSNGVRGLVPRRTLTSEVRFTGIENAPRKLNRAVRELRARVLEPS